MAKDISRSRFDPLKDFAAVELKQGGVLLDADVNELVAIFDRRFRALASDTMGRATVSTTTPSAFQITIATGGGLQIGKGRLYVDGLLAENHGEESKGAKRAFDGLMAESTFVDTIPYAGQPYLPNPPTLPKSGLHLVYLDVWDREVTHLEQPDLVESAVAVETSSRMQTVWQVHVLSDDAATDTTCGSSDRSIPGWSSVIEPSTGVLTTDTFDIVTTDDPCDLPPTGGYRGPENQLYRVEIHDRGQPGTATFKWSRDNASVGSRVARMISNTELELDSLGRDAVLRFNSDDWVEIIDDMHEFSQRCGEMRKITVNPAGNIAFTPALPAEMRPGAFPSSDFPRARNLRVRRWDQKHKVLQTGTGGTTSVFQDLDAAASKGVIAVPAAAGTTLILENGVTVSFASTGAAGFKAGDHWEFAARAADASVEILDRAPPRGIHHHYARLGIWNVAGGTVTDCRHPSPADTGGGDCSCTACVTPKSQAGGRLTIQVAVKTLGATGGTICLEPGTYVLDEPVRIAAATSLRIRGQGPATRIVAAGAAFIIERSANIAIEDLAVFSLGRESAISVRSVFGLALRRLSVAVFGGSDAKGAAIALSGTVMAASIDNNLLVAPDGVRALESTDEKAPNMLMTAMLRIDDNVFWCRDTAVKLTGQVVHAYETRITGNHVQGCHVLGLCAEGVSLPGASIRISDNYLTVHSSGIRCAVDGARIEGNKVNATGDGHRELTGVGIELTTGLDRSGRDHAQVLANQINGFPDAGIAIDAPVQELIVNLNVVENCGNGIVMTDGASAGSLSIENNHLRDIGIRGNTLNAMAGATVGIGITRTGVATVAGNTLRKIGLNAPENKRLIAGIAAFSVQHARVSGNEVSEIGPEADFGGGSVAGITILAPFLQAEVMHNHVKRDAHANNTKSGTNWFALQIHESALDDISRIAGYATLRVDASRTLVLFGDRAYVNDVISAAGLDPAGVAATAEGSCASIISNMFAARGSVPVVDVTASGEVLFNNNRCELRGSLRTTTAVLLKTPVAIINANRVRGGYERSSISAPISNPKTLIAIGNITTFPIEPMPPEMLPLNVLG